jgi:hypothetical protein
LTDPSGPISKSTSDELSWPRHEILPVVSLTCPMTVTSDTPSESLSDFLPPPRYFCYDNSELLDAGGVGKSSVEDKPRNGSPRTHRRIRRGRPFRISS